MSVVRRRRDAIEALEHAMRGVQTTEKRPLVRPNEGAGIIGKRSEVELADDTPVEHEVTIVMPRIPRRRERMR
jgi:hypothetical protein